MKKLQYVLLLLQVVVFVVLGYIIFVLVNIEDRIPPDDENPVYGLNQEVSYEYEESFWKRLFKSRARKVKYLQIEDKYYYPQRDPRLNKNVMNAIASQIYNDDPLAMATLKAQVVKDEIAKYDTIRMKVEIEIDSEFDQAMVWINGFYMPLPGSYGSLENLPLRPDSIDLYIMASYPDKGALSGKMQIDGKSAEFEFKDGKAYNHFKKRFSFKAFGIDSCKYLDACRVNTNF